MKRITTQKQRLVARNMVAGMLVKARARAFSIITPRQATWDDVISKLTEIERSSVASRDTIYDSMALRSEIRSAQVYGDIR